MQINLMVLIDIRSSTQQGLDYFEINKWGGGGGSLDSPREIRNMVG